MKDVDRDRLTKRCGQLMQLVSEVVMVYDTPKAAHFSASKGGKLLDDDDPIGLNARWKVARRCRELVSDMRNLSFADRHAVVLETARFNSCFESFGVKVQLRLNEQQDDPSHSSS